MCFLSAGPTQSSKPGRFISSTLYTSSHPVSHCPLCIHSAYLPQQHSTRLVIRRPRGCVTLPPTPAHRTTPLAFATQSYCFAPLTEAVFDV